MSNELLQHALNWLATRGESSIAIVGWAEQVLRHGVNDHISRTGVEGDNVLGAVRAAESQ